MNNLVVFYSLSKSKEWEFLGNGVVISDDGTICTVGHLFLNSKDVDPDGDFKCELYLKPEINTIIRVEEMLICQYKENGLTEKDWAVFQSEKFNGMSPLETSKIDLDNIYSISGVNSIDSQIVEFAVETRLWHSFAFPYMVYGTLPPEIVKGTSGSPVFDEAGNIVGLVSGCIPHPNQIPSEEIRVLSLEHVLELI